MTGEDLLKALSGVKDAYIQEAEFTRSRRDFRPWAAVAACAAVLAVILLAFKPSRSAAPQSQLPGGAQLAVPTEPAAADPEDDRLLEDIQPEHTFSASYAEPTDPAPVKPEMIPSADQPPQACTRETVILTVSILDWEGDVALCRVESSESLKYKAGDQVQIAFSPEEKPQQMPTADQVITVSCESGEDGLLWGTVNEEQEETQ